MGELKIEISDDTTAFTPGQSIQGTIQWNLEENPESLELSLFWHTIGKGTKDISVVERLKLDNPGSFDKKQFSFKLPQGPYSFSGKLISLIWALELTSCPGDQTVRKEITVSHTGREILLDQSQRRNLIPEQ